MSRHNRNRHPRDNQPEQPVEEAVVEEPVVEQEEQQEHQEAVSIPGPGARQQQSQPEALKEEPKVEAPQVTPKLQPVVEQPVPTTNKVNTVSDLEKKLVSYADAMQDKKLTDKDISKVQHGFFLVLRGLLNKENPEEFRRGWNQVLAFANKNKATVFNEENMFRGAAAWPTSDTEFTLFRRLGWLIICTADHAKRREALNNIALDKVTVGLKQRETTHLLNFYS